MKEHPILFTAEMVRAILAGQKTQTRRIVKNCWLSPKITLLQLLNFLGGGGTCDESDENGLITTFVREYDRKNDGQKPYKYTGLLVQSAAVPEDGVEEIPHPYGQPGDRLWVKETFAPHPEFPGYIYRADRGGDYQGAAQGDFKWKPSIFMPRVASRLTLEIKTIRVERLQDISEADALAEGIQEFSKDGHLKKYWPCDPCEGVLKCTWVDLPRTAIEAYRSLWESINGARSWSKNPWVWVIEFKKLDSAPFAFSAVKTSAPSASSCKKSVFHP